VVEVIAVPAVHVDPDPVYGYKLVDESAATNMVGLQKLNWRALYPVRVLMLVGVKDEVGKPVPNL
jgi:hypothetical protein